LAGDGLGEFAYVHVESLVEAIVMALRSEAASGQVINIVDGQATWRQYTDRFRKADLPSIPAAPAPARLTSRAQISNAKAVKLLGHGPKRTFEEAMEETQRYLQATP
jgi:nucleoside-diphosphate-sugar epimerase